MRIPPTHTLIRTAVVLAIIGLPLLIGILLTISVMAVGFFMLGSMLITTGIVLHPIAVIRELGSTEAL